MAQATKAENLPEDALNGDAYDNVDYTEEVTKRLGIKRSEDGAIQGVFDPESGKPYLIASNLSPETAPGVFVHEVGVHMAADGSGRAAVLLPQTELTIWPISSASLRGEGDGAIL
ncbi:MAG: hypothetical protein V8R49_04905 [Duodenibacillus massiliensis]